MPNPNQLRDAYRQIIEALPDIGGRFFGPAYVGDGYSSLVFSATDQQTAARVAVKIYRPDRLSDVYRYQSFRREATLLHRLRGSPNILECVSEYAEFDVPLTTANGIPVSLKFPYYAAELASTDVAEVIRNDWWTSEEKLLGFREMCKALQRVHHQTMAHRDIKPDNFLVMPTGQVKISDFGTARDLTEAGILTQYGAPPGHILYSAPELLAGLHDADPSIALRSDLYSLGATLFELWCGTKLGVTILSSNFASDLAQATNAVKINDRIRIFCGFIRSLAAAHPLPALSSFQCNAPTCIRPMIDDLYRSMAALDFRERLTDFERIFLRINQCLIVLRNERSFERWQEQKELRRQRHRQKCLARITNVPPRSLDGATS
jgi:serine/threonine protein kinase